MVVRKAWGCLQQKLSNISQYYTAAERDEGEDGAGDPSEMRGPALLQKYRPFKKQYSTWYQDPLTGNNRETQAKKIHSTKQESAIWERKQPQAQKDESAVVREQLQWMYLLKNSYKQVTRCIFQPSHNVLQPTHTLCGWSNRSDDSFLFS